MFNAPPNKSRVVLHLLICACIVSAVLVVAFKCSFTTLTPRMVRGPQQLSNSGCTYINVAYAPSDLEQQWSANARAWAADDRFCDHIKPFERQVETWLQGVVATHMPSLATASFSSFQHTYDCEGVNVTYTTYIEPLSHGLRHPWALCDLNTSSSSDATDPHLANTSYILFATASETGPARGQQCVGRTCQNILFDLGKDGHGAVFFREMYRQRGLELNRVLQWRADRSPNDAQQQAHQRFDLTGVADPENRSSPLRLIKEIAQPGDFVAFKLDIDDYHVEHAIVKELLSDEAVIRLVDELFFEDHVQFAPMLQYRGGSAHPDRTLADSYDLFAQLRRKGIRAHSWV